jgi:hypothetical protein
MRHRGSISVRQELKNMVTEPWSRRNATVTLCCSGCGCSQPFITGYWQQRHQDFRGRESELISGEGGQYLRLKEVPNVELALHFRLEQK